MVWYQREGCGLEFRVVLLQMLFPATGRGYFLLEMLSRCAIGLQSLCQQWQSMALSKTWIYYLQGLLTFQLLLCSQVEVKCRNWEDLRGAEKLLNYYAIFVKGQTSGHAVQFCSVGPCIFPPSFVAL